MAEATTEEQNKVKKQTKKWQEMRIVLETSWIILNGQIFEL